MECKEEDRNLYVVCLRKLRQVNQYMEDNGRPYRYDLTYSVCDGTGMDYMLRGRDMDGRVLFIRAFTYCDRLLSYLSGMCHIIEDVENSKNI